MGAAGTDVTGDEVSAIDNDDLWERLDREKLGRDPRAGIYDRLFNDDFRHSDWTVEPLIELLETLRESAPAHTGLASPARPPQAPPVNPVRAHHGRRARGFVSAPATCCAGGQQPKRTRA